MSPINAVLFDLDGTLLDTASDLGQALNQLLTEYKLPSLPVEKIRPVAGHGCRGLLKVGFNIDEHHSRYADLCEKLLMYYHQCLLNTTQLFPGMEDVLIYLEKNHIPWGIVTNKPERFTHTILTGLQLTQRAKCIISGDSLKNRKPHPEPILHACKLLHKNPNQCLYIGDSESDIIASKAAGTMSLTALYGYIPAGVNPHAWGADGYIKQPVEIMNWFFPEFDLFPSPPTFSVGGEEG